MPEPEHRFSIMWPSYNKSMPFAGHSDTVLIGHHQHFGKLSTVINTITRGTAAMERAKFRFTVSGCARLAGNELLGAALIAASPARAAERRVDRGRRARTQGNLVHDLDRDSGDPAAA